MNQAYLLTGGNMGNRSQNLARARKLIESNCGRIRQFSSLYETAAWGKTDQPAFLNQALQLETILSPRALLQQILEIEKKIGRIREEKYGPRIIDIDILLYDDKTINEAGLVLPHPELPNRRFALAPLAEIAPEMIHPVSKKTIGQLLDECPDILAVKKI
jgi:2-amino-4-hydroxy-6-hydroxymethyldihydropteridine diphosphokinase